MTRTTDVFVKISVFLLAVLSLAIFAGKAETATAQMLGEAKRDTVDFSDVFNLAKKIYNPTDKSAVEIKHGAW